MKKSLLITMLVLLASLAARADVTINSTNFPDANFRAFLMDQYPNGKITTAQLNARTELDVEDKNISNMKGVEFFTNLTRLDCYNNNLTSIDVSALTKLTYLHLGYNKMTSLNVDNNTLLEELYLQNNQLTTLSIHDHSKLKTLWVHNNPLLTGLYCWRNNLTNFTVSNCTKLESLKCYENSSLTAITGLEQCTALTYLDCEDCWITDLSGVNSLTKLEQH